MKISIITQFENAEKFYGIWAFDENKINFFKEHEKATRCTVCYAVVELKSHLENCLKNAMVRVASDFEDDSFNIVLTANDFTVRGENYRIIPKENGLKIEGDGRVGVLYGVYEFLKLQGYRWFEPGDVGTIVPSIETLTVPTQALSFKSTSPIGRGFSIDGKLNENEELFSWMVKNRLNVYFNFPNSAKMLHKFGFILRDGGHIFTDIIATDRVLPSGKTVWEEHPEWYGVPANGKKNKELAQFTQFCVTNTELLDFLSEELIDRIMTVWSEADEINVWGFDTWGDVCCCEKCKALGNSTDQMLYMASYFRDKINKARREGKIDRDIKIVLCSYEGSSSLFAPQNPVPENLIEAGDHILFSPIARCYEHEIKNDGCIYNSEYNDALQSWAKLDRCIPLDVLEYYNVSKFEDLPLLFISTMQKDFIHYYESGVRGFSYMHIPMVNWGVRALTQVLYAELSYDVYCDTQKIIEEYFANRYGKYSEIMKTAYAIIDDASKQITSWRAWKSRSVLEKLFYWDGKAPSSPLDVDDHLKSADEFEKIGAITVEKWKKALEIVKGVLLEEKNSAISGEIAKAVNPEELRKLKSGSNVLKLLRDDMRGLIYAVDTYELTLYLGCYYNALARGESGECEFKKVEEVEERLESYYMPATFTCSQIIMISKSALERTQLLETIQRCRSERNK